MGTPPGLDNPFHEEIFLNLQSEHPLVQLEVLSPLQGKVFNFCRHQEHSKLPKNPRGAWCEDLGTQTKQIFANSLLFAFGSSC